MSDSLEINSINKGGEGNIHCLLSPHVDYEEKRNFIIPATSGMCTYSVDKHRPR